MEIDQEIFNIMLAKRMHQIARIEFRNSKFPYATCNSRQGLYPLNPRQPPGTPVIGQQFGPPFQWLDPPLPNCNPMYEQLINHQGNMDLVLSQLTAHNWQKWKRVFLTCLCHKIEAVGLKICKYTWKKSDICENVEFWAILWKFDILSIPV